MKLGEIKIEALKLMFADSITDYKISELESLFDDEVCRSYLVNMPGAINRAFSNLESRGVLPPRQTLLSPEKGIASGPFIRFDLSQIPDYKDVLRVVYENERSEYNPNAEYRREGDVLVLAVPLEGERYTLLYKPRLARITNTTDNNLEIEVPEHIAALIPYFVKGDLYRDDEPTEAATARNIYEAAISESEPENDGGQNKVESVYGVRW